jgi:hypothetical protein
MTKALTVKNPWAWLIEKGIKDIENRTWRTNFRGRVLIHAAASSALRKDQALFEILSKEQWQEFKKWDKIDSQKRPVILSELFSDVPTSEIICSVEIVDCVQNHPSIWAENNKGLPEDGYIIKPIWNWVLANPRPEPDYAGLKIKGSLSFWDLTDDRIIGKEVSNV